MHTAYDADQRMPLVVEFKDLKTGSIFVDEHFGGLWRKIDADQAVCLMDDSAYKAGEVAIFQLWEQCIPAWLLYRALTPTTQGLTTLRNSGEIP